MNRRQIVPFVFLGLPCLAVIGWFMCASAGGGRALLVVDVPSDVELSLDGRLQRPCLDEYHAPPSCKAEPTAGWSRRYAYVVYRGKPVDIVAKRGFERAERRQEIKVDGPAPHLRLDELPLAWRHVGGVSVHQDSKAFFVNAEGKELGEVGHSDPD